MKQSTTDIFNAIEQIAAENPYHPVRTYLTGLAWDGVERLNHAAEDLLGCEGSALNIAMMRKWFISAVARALEPGCKVDTVLVLVGPQGALKSTFFQTLAGIDWYTNTAVDVHSKDAFLALRGKWICEWAELESLKRAKDATTIKSFISSSHDNYRAPYQRYAQNVARDSVIVGTSNPAEFLTDDTGNRRFWPLTVGAIDIELTASWRDQLWAEAVKVYRAGVPWWLDEPEREMLETRHKDHDAREDVWEEPIADWCARQIGDTVTTLDALRLGLQMEITKCGKSEQMRVARILRGLGYEKVRPSATRKAWRRRNTIK